MAQIVKNLPDNVRDLGLNPWVRKIPWRSEWQSTPVFLPEEFHEQKSLVGYKQSVAESDMIEATFTNLLLKNNYHLSLQ